MPEPPHSKILSGVHVDCSALPPGSAPCPNYCGLLLNRSFHLGLHLTIICASKSVSLADSHPGPPHTHLQVVRVHVERQDAMEPTVLHKHPLPPPPDAESAPSVGFDAAAAGVFVCFQAASDALSSLGHVYTSIGDYPNALASHKQCVLLARQTQCQLSEARQLGNMGAVYTALGDFTNAVQCHEQHLSIAKVQNYSHSVRFLSEAQTIYSI